MIAFEVVAAGFIYPIHDAKKTDDGYVEGMRKGRTVRVVMRSKYSSVVFSWKVAKMQARRNIAKNIEMMGREIEASHARSRAVAACDSWDAYKAANKL